MWPPWARGAKRPSSTSPDPELDGTCIPLADLRSSVSPGGEGQCRLRFDMFLFRPTWCDYFPKYGLAVGARG